MVSERPTRIPFAIWRPSQNHGFWGAKISAPTAFFAHSADSVLYGDGPPDRLLYPSANPGSTHLWFEGDGRLYQTIELDEPAWGNGVDYDRFGYHRTDGWESPHVLVREWYRLRRNPNLDCWSAEFSGQGISRPGKFSKLTEPQIASWIGFAEWAKAEGWFSPTLQNVLLHQYVVPTACPDGRFTPAELIGYLNDAGEDEMGATPNEREILYGLVDLLIGRADGIEYVNDIERLLALRAAISDDLRFAVGLGATQQKVAELAAQVKALSTNVPLTGPELASIADKVAKIEAALRHVGDRFTNLGVEQPNGNGDS